MTDDEWAVLSTFPFLLCIVWFARMKITCPLVLRVIEWFFGYVPVDDISIPVGSFSIVLVRKNSDRGTIPIGLRIFDQDE